jgi:hypothetical protein
MSQVLNSLALSLKGTLFWACKQLTITTAKTANTNFIAANEFPYIISAIGPFIRGFL